MTSFPSSCCVFLWTARQLVYFSKSVKCIKSLIGRVKREKKGFNVFSPVPLSVFSLDPDLRLTARAYLNAQKHGLFHSLPSLLLNNEIFEYRRSHPSFKPNQKFTRSQSFKRTLSRVGKANPRYHRSTKVWKFKQKLISLKGTSSICVKCKTENRRSFS